MNEARADEVGSAPRAKVSADSARRAGRGILSITASKLWFLVAGYAAQLLLPRLLGSPEAFGLFSTALSFVSILNNVMVGATIQVVSKRVSESPERAPHTLRQGLELQAVLGLALAGTLFLCAPLLAANVLLDPLLTPLFRLAAAVVLAYALYTAFVGALNGQQQFRTQARFDMAYTTMRSGGMITAAALGFGAVGVFYGFALASWLVVLASAFVVGLGKAGRRTPLRSWLSFMAPLWVYQLCLNLVMQIDVTLLKRSVAALLQASGSDFASAAETASRYVGFYRAAQTFAFVPYQLIMPVPLVIFPMISQALSLGDEAAAARYIRAALRFSLLMLLGVAAPIAGAAKGVMMLVYPAAYAAGAPALAVLGVAMVCLALFVSSATIMTGAGRPGLAAAVASVAVVCVVGGNIGFVKYAGVGEHTLLAAALGTGCGTLVALALMGYAVYARFGGFIAPLSLARALVAGAAAYLVAHALASSGGKLHTLIAAALGAASFVVTLIVLRELTRADLDAVSGMVRRKRGS